MSIKERFLEGTDKTGRFIVESLVTGVVYYVEPIGDQRPADWGDINPATNKIEGNYGVKHIGCIKADESLITIENGFDNIELLGPGISPLSEIYRRDKEYELKQKQR